LGAGLPGELTPGVGDRQQHSVRSGARGDRGGGLGLPGALLELGDGAGGRILQHGGSLSPGGRRFCPWSDTLGLIASGLGDDVLQVEIKYPWRGHDLNKVEDNILFSRLT
jgi:hypothetical protein